MKKFVFSLILSVFLIGCNEENRGPSIWNGKTDTEWYEESKNEFTITTAEQLAGFAKLVNYGNDLDLVNKRNDFEGKIVKLGQNIILNDTANWQDWANNAPVNEWTPIGIKGAQFNGIFDGNGYVVSGIYTSNSDYNQGLFKYINSGIRNFKFSTSYIKDKEFVDGQVFNIITPQQLQLALESLESAFIIVVTVSNNYLEIMARGGSFPKLSFNDMNVYDEFANQLNNIIIRVISPVNIIVVFTNMVSDEIITNIVDKVKESGFFGINLAKIDDDELEKYKEERKKEQEKMLKKYSLQKKKKEPSGNSQGGLKIHSLSSMEVQSISKSGETETKSEISAGTPGKIGNALGNLMLESMKKERGR